MGIQLAASEAVEAAHNILQTGKDMAEISTCLRLTLQPASYCRAAARRLHTAAVTVIDRLGSSELDAEAQHLDRFLSDQGA